MFATLRGPITSLSTDSCTIEAGSIGFRVIAMPSTLSKLALHAPALLHTAFVVRENSQALYGFLDEASRDLFETLLGISGIGPKTALAIIGHTTINDLIDTLMRKDIASLTKIPGIGKKSAERLMIDLKSTLPVLTRITPNSMPLSHDATSALINLGYSHPTAHHAVKRALDSTPTADLPALIASALQLARAP